MHTRAEVAEELASLAAELTGPMPKSAASDGWTEATWTKWGHIFKALHTTVLAGESEVPGGIARAMDFDGVIGGSILDRAAGVSIALARL